MQFGQRVAAIGMVVRQNWHSLVVGSAGAGACFTMAFPLGSETGDEIGQQQRGLEIRPEQDFGQGDGR